MESVELGNKSSVCFVITTIICAFESMLLLFYVFIGFDMHYTVASIFGSAFVLWLLTNLVSSIYTICTHNTAMRAFLHLMTKIVIIFWATIIGLLTILWVVILATCDADHCQVFSLFLYIYGIILLVAVGLPEYFLLDETNRLLEKLILSW